MGMINEFRGLQPATPAAGDRPTIGGLRRSIAARLRRSLAVAGRAGTPELDARLLVAHAAGLEPGEVPLCDEQPAPEEMTAAAMTFAERRVAGEPVARIVGHKEFYGLDLMLSPETLVPRPDTETLVDATLTVVDRQWGRQAEITIVDLGTGSGAILLALLSELPVARGLGTDISAGALVTARNNARRLRLADRASFVVADWSEAIASPVSVIVANPPYITSDAVATLDREVRHDPRRALDGGADGLDAVRVILSDLGRILSSDGSALIEIGWGQGPAVRALAASAGFAVRLDRDLAGIDRVAIVSRWHHSFDTR